VLLALAAFLAAGCLGPGTEPSPSTSPAQPLIVAQLKYRLMDELGRPWFCDPDQFPVGRDEMASMRERFPEIEADPETLDAILARIGLVPRDRELTDDERLAIYREWKALNAIVLEPRAEEGVAYRFDLLTVPAPGAADGMRSAGYVDDRDRIFLEQQAPAGEPSCPICLAPSTLIATPDGPRPVAHLRAGDPIWTTDPTGRRLAATIRAVGSVAVPPAHRLVELVLADGRSLRASPGHPLADGRPIGSLNIGDPVDGSVVASAELVASDPSTVDVRPSGPTGFYWANGIVVRSTLQP